MFQFLRYILTQPRKAARTFWRTLTDTEDPAEFVQKEEVLLNALGVAIFLYKTQFGRLPTKLEDLCFNNHNDPTWDGPFINWRGPDTFKNMFGFPYRYSVGDGKYSLYSPGLDAAKGN